MEQGQMMKAYRLKKLGEMPVIEEVKVPEPGFGQVLIKMAGAGLCHTDLLMTDEGVELQPWIGEFTLGHENAGWIEKKGPGVKDFEIGESVVVCATDSCGYCEACLSGHDNFCLNVNARGCQAGRDGGLAEYMVAPARQLVSLGSLNPAQFAVLTDAALSPYASIVNAKNNIPANGYCVVLGVGGLGSYAVQLLKLTTSAKVIAVDINPERRALAERLGADCVFDFDEKLVDNIIEFTENRKVNAYFDFVGSSESMNVGAAVTKELGMITVNGLAGGTMDFTWGKVRPGVDVRFSSNGTIIQLGELVDLAKRGDLIIETQEFRFDQVPEALDELRHGRLRGRALIVFD
ncbi:alcohol dehydrogenase catalytic domain-containing protein [Enterococcus sp. AZ109]|uniref:alcohol dehydrogenase catalytic domain-containing protein n=1 Tax=Enterococcus sp. AZ109 TaxID=2774634 RepID=UPI003F2761BD